MRASGGVSHKLGSGACSAFRVRPCVPARPDMLKIDLKVDISGPLRLVQQELPRALPYVQASMLTGLAQRVQEKVRGQMPVSFDRPTPFSVRGVFVKAATKTEPVAEVYFPESQDSMGKAKREYMRPGALGAPKRRQKRTEFLLSKTGYLPAGWVTTPGTSAEKHGYMDGYGNVKPRVYAQIVNVLQLKPASGLKGARGISERSARRAKAMGTDAEFFAVPPGKNTAGKGGAWLPPGVYKRVGKKKVESLHQVLKFVSTARYDPRIDIEALAREEVAKSLQAEFDRAYASVKQRFAANAARKGG